eukprot:TRINITY_DN1988_c0_g2_i1.p1 TRINITY_DN1988_c0_g2~~TRINITY_DN1988_c0_g2_i1.p1  ORF type:complete len:140 (-),score=28.68 TRINITY_DN1988_c0_g2_i1:444-863(-)
MSGNDSDDSSSCNNNDNTTLENEGTLPHETHSSPDQTTNEREVNEVNEPKHEQQPVKIVLSPSSSSSAGGKSNNNITSRVLQAIDPTNIISQLSQSTNLFEKLHLDSLLSLSLTSNTISKMVRPFISANFWFHYAENRF